MVFERFSSFLFIVQFPLLLGSLRLGGGSVPSYTCAGERVGSVPSYYSF